jgi:hypothetical protein
VPARVYSHRFLYQKVPNAVKEYRVPEGMRAVIRNVTIVNLATVGGAAYVHAHGITAVLHVFQVTYTYASIDLRLAVYGGELMDVITNAAGVEVTVSGYLFDDPAHESFPPSGPLGKPIVDPPRIPSPPELALPR